jgi:hypothetical protein
MGFVAVCTRFIFDESYAYQVNKKNLSKSPILEFIKYYKRPILVSIGIGIAQNASVSIKSDKKNWYVTLRTVYICDNISLLSSKSDKFFK